MEISEDPKDHGATDEQITKLALLDIKARYLGGVCWFTGKEANWFMASGMQICPHNIWPEKIKPSDFSEQAKTSSAGWNMSFRTLDDLIDAAIRLRENEKAKR